MQQDDPSLLRPMRRSLGMYTTGDQHLLSGHEQDRNGQSVDRNSDNGSSYSFSRYYTKSSELNYASFDKKMSTFDPKTSKFKKALNAPDPLKRVNSMYSPKSVYEELQMARRVKLPKALQTLHHVLHEYDDSGEDLSELPLVEKYLPYIAKNKLVKIEPQMLYSNPTSRCSSTASCSKEPNGSKTNYYSETYFNTYSGKEFIFSEKMRIGLCLSGGPAPGGHNVIAGVFDFLKSRNQESQLIGFLGGIDGLKYKRYHVITDEMMDQYRNLGGFNMLLSGRGMVSTKSEFDMVVKTVTELELDGLIIVGGDGSNSNAANISNYLEHHYATLAESLANGKPIQTVVPDVFKKSDSMRKMMGPTRANTMGEASMKRCSVVGVPKTVDGDIRSANIEITFGFDTAARTLSELVGNLCTDAATTQYNYHFVRIMGRSASHLALECALQTHPNMLLVSEEVSQKNISLQKIVDDIVELIKKRYEMGKTFGVILIPEGLVEFIPDFKVLVEELNQVITNANTAGTTLELSTDTFDTSLLNKSKETWEFLPSTIQEQLLSDIETSGCIYVAKIATESLISMLVESQLASRQLHHLQEILFMTHYFGYEGRCAIPSEFDSSYCYSLGYTAAVLVSQKKTGYMSAIRGLKDGIEDWVPLGIPFAHLTTLVEAPRPKALPTPLEPKSRMSQTHITFKDLEEKNKEKEREKEKEVVAPPEKRMRCSIRKSLLDLNGELFMAFEKVRNIWAYEDLYRSPGPIQLTNANTFNENTNLAKYLESYSNYDKEREENMSISNASSKADSFDLLEINERRCYTLEIPTMEELVGNFPFKDEYRALRRKDRSFMSELEKTRLDVIPEIPLVCRDPRCTMVPFKQQFDADQYVKNQIMLHYPYQHKNNQFNQYELVRNTQMQPMVVNDTKRDGSTNRDSSVSLELLSLRQLEKLEGREEGLKIGVVPVGKHAPGVLNVFWGIFERTKQMGGKCYAFHGVKGLLEKSYLELVDEDFECFRNQGGLELVLRSKRSFLHKQEKIDKVLKTCTAMDLDGLVFLGDEMSMTQASLVTEYFMSKNSKTCVVGVPVAGGNTLGGKLIEACVGFDTNARIYASLVGNVLTDAISMPKYWHFVKILGRYPSIEVLECALQTHPNVIIIAEEYRNADKTLFDIVDEIANAVVKRSKLGKNFGTVLIPDHLVLHLPNTKNMLQEIGNVLIRAMQMNKRKQAIQELMNYSLYQSARERGESPEKEEKDEFVKMITPWSLAVFTSFPEYIRKEILKLDFGEVTLESLEIEVMLAKMVKEELAVRKKRGEYTGNYAAVTHYFGYQGRCAMPSEFDCSLAYTYGHLAAICVESKLSGFCCSIRAVCGTVKDWKLFAAPFTCMMKIAPDSFKMLINPKSEMPIIPSNSVSLNGKAFRKLKSARRKWLIEDLFNNPGPIQFNAFIGTQNITIIIDHSQYYHMITSVERFTEIIKNICKFGVSEEYLYHAFIQLWSLIKITQDKNQLIDLTEDFK